MIRTIGWLLSGMLLSGVASPAAAQREQKASLPAPLPVAANTVSPGVVLITWPVVQKAATYELVRCEGTACAVKTSPRITAGQPLEFKDNLTVGGSYLYTVTAFSSRNLPLAEGKVGYVWDGPLTAVLMPPPGGTITPIQAGPAQLTAVSPVPGQIHLAWSPVPNASTYRILRSNSGGLVDQRLPEKSANSILTNGFVTDVDGPIDFRWTYSYKVHAVFQSATGETLSASSPVASTTSLPFVQVSSVSYTTVPSTTKPGRLNLNITWTSVKDVIKYLLWDGTGALLYDPTGKMVGEVWAPTTNLVVRDLPVNWTGADGYTVCVGAVYAFNVQQQNTAPCIVLKF